MAFSYTKLTNITEQVKRFLHKSTISGNFSQDELELYAQDANYLVDMDYPDFGSYTITTGLGITDTVDSIDSTLIALKAAILINNALSLESIGDAVMIRSGDIVLDTSRSLRARGVFNSELDNLYNGLLDKLIINGKSSSTVSIGKRIDNYISVVSDNDNIDPEGEL